MRYHDEEFGVVVTWTVLKKLRDEHGFAVIFGIDPDDEASLEKWDATAEDEANGCCGSCATSWLSQAPNEHFAHVNIQSIESLERGSDDVYVGFSDEAAARKIVEVATEVGVVSEWEGDVGKKVRLRFPSCGGVTWNR